jgi:hypothetical protein
VSVLLLKLVEETSKAGNVYLTGLLGGLRVHAFRAKNDPAVWNVFLRPERKKAAAETPSNEDIGGRQ